MKARFRFSRTITVGGGFAADPDPNTSLPSADKIWELGHDLAPGEDARGHMLTVAFNTNEPTGTVTVATWWRDAGSGEWFLLAASETITHRRLRTTSDLIGGEVFVQALAHANHGGATNATIRMGEA